MIITDKNKRMQTLENICNKKSSLYYKVLPTGELQINGYFKSHVFLAYVNGNWYASYGARKGSSISIPEEGMDLFIHSNNSIWIKNTDGEVDYASSDLPLDESTHFALFAFSGKDYHVIVADGSKYNTPISTYLKKEPANVNFLVFALTSFIQQYDDQATKEILEFWANKNASNNNRVDYHPQIQSYTSIM